jgi:hypothetical protein
VDLIGLTLFSQGNIIYINIANPYIKGYE